MSTRMITSNSKCTRGEKCICAHVIVTVACVACVLLVYVAHLCLVAHADGDAYRISRRSHTDSQLTYEGEDASVCAGAAIVGERRACGTVWVRTRWSLAPAACVSARQHPHLAGGWSRVSRGVVHPLFESEEVASDVGLFLHETDIMLSPQQSLCDLPADMNTEDELAETDSRDIIIVQWLNDTTGEFGGSSSSGGVWRVEARALSPERCSRVMSALLRRHLLHETCLTPTLPPGSIAQQDMHTGAAVLVRSRVVGVTSWGGGEPRSAFPLVMLQLAPHKQWIDTTIAYSYTT